MTALPTVVSLRVALGLLLLAGVEQSHLPGVVRILGILTLLGAVIVLLIGQQRLQRMLEWWLAKPSWFVRCWCVAAAGMGGLLFYAGGMGAWLVL